VTMLDGKEFPEIMWKEVAAVPLPQGSKKR
jgi:hypothetical protein